MTGPMEQQVRITLREVSLDGLLVIPEAAKGIVIFAHGSGSSRMSPRNRFVAGVLQKAGLGTLLFDLLTKEEDASYANRFDIDHLAARLAGATRWLAGRPQATTCRWGTSAPAPGSAALQAAAEVRVPAKTVVSRGGRPDLAMHALPLVTVPTLLIVGALDEEVIHLNRMALCSNQCHQGTGTGPGATHLFEEPGTLEQRRNWPAIGFCAICPNVGHACTVTSAEAYASSSRHHIRSLLIVQHYPLPIHFQGGAPVPFQLRSHHDGGSRSPPLCAFKTWNCF